MTASNPDPADRAPSPSRGLWARWRLSGWASSRAYRAACACALGAGFLLIWINGAVGILGSENNPLNLIYGGVMVVAVVGALVAGFEARRMALAMRVTAGAQALVGVVVLLYGYFTPLVTAFFMALWLAAATLFEQAAVAPPAPAVVDIGRNRFWRAMRWVVWGGAAVLLALPAVAMQFDTGVDWTAFDFVVMGLMLGSVCGMFELAMRVARSHAYVIAFGVAAATAFFAVWINLAVGIIGSEDNPINAIFFGVLAIGFIAVALTRFEALRMARAMELTAAAQAVTVLVTVALGEHYVFVLPSVFVAMWLASAQLFRLAARQEAAVSLNAT